jgi:ATP-binding cassette subfamily B protein
VPISPPPSSGATPAAFSRWRRRRLVPFLNRRTIVGVSREFEYSLRNEFFAHLQRLDLGYFQRTRTGDLMSRATNDLTAVRMLMGPAVLYTSSTVLTFVVAVVLMISIDPWLTLLALVPLPSCRSSSTTSGSASTTASSRSGAALHRERGHAGVAGRRPRRARLPAGAVRARRVPRRNAEYVRATAASSRCRRCTSRAWAADGLRRAAGAVAGQPRGPARRITIGELVAFNAYLAMLAWPMIAFGWVTNLWQRGMASWKRMLECSTSSPWCLTCTRWPMRRPRRTQSAATWSSGT